MYTWGKKNKISGTEEREDSTFLILTSKSCKLKYREAKTDKSSVL